MRNGLIFHDRRRIFGGHFENYGVEDVCLSGSARVNDFRPDVSLFHIGEGERRLLRRAHRYNLVLESGYKKAVVVLGGEPPSMRLIRHERAPCDNYVAL